MFILREIGCEISSSDMIMGVTIICGGDMLLP